MSDRSISVGTIAPAPDALKMAKAPGTAFSGPLLLGVTEMDVRIARQCLHAYWVPSHPAPGINRGKYRYSDGPGPFEAGAIHRCQYHTPSPPSFVGRYRYLDGSCSGSPIIARGINLRRFATKSAADYWLIPGLSGNKNSGLNFRRRLLKNS